VKSEKSNRENAPSLLPPLQASEVEAKVSLIPPHADGTEVQEKATGENAVDLQRYVQLADKLMEKDNRPETGKPEDKNKTGAVSSAA
jgi:hypothetical protein